MVTQAFSTQDGNLQVPSIITSGMRLSKDINLLFGIKTSGDVFKKEDAAAVKQSVKNILMTNKFEKPFNHTFGCDLSGLLFELADDLLEDDISNAIENAIENWEPRAKILSVQTVVTPDRNDIKCRIEYKIVTTGIKDVIETSVARLR